MSASITAETRASPDTVRRGRNYARHYWAFAAPAAVVVLAVILFPWLFTVFMSVHDWKVTGDTPFVGLANYVKMFGDSRFQWAVWRTLVFTAASVVAPVVLGVWAAVCFASKFPLRGLARTLFVLPMVCRPFVALVVLPIVIYQLRAEQRRNLRLGRH